MDESDEKFVLRGAKTILFYSVFQKLNVGFRLYTGTQAGSLGGTQLKEGMMQSVWNLIEIAKEKNTNNNYQLKV
jgi:hypothetical protein